MMAVEEMKAAVSRAYRQHLEQVQVLRQAPADGSTVPVRLEIPVLSGPGGVGKTAVVKEFAAEM